MRLSSQQNMFLFNFPQDFISNEVEDRLKNYMLKNWIPYENPMAYINSTIKELNFPSITYEGSEQVLKYGKKIEHKPAINIYDTYNSSLDITMRSVDSNTNYFMLQQIFAEYYNNTRKHYIPWLNLIILDKDGDFMYSVIFRSALLKSLSEIRFAYQTTDIAEQTFSITFKYNYMDIYWSLTDNPDYKKDNILHSQTWDHSNDVLPAQRPQLDI